MNIYFFDKAKFGLYYITLMPDLTKSKNKPWYDLMLNYFESNDIDYDLHKEAGTPDCLIFIITHEQDFIFLQLAFKGLSSDDLFALLSPSKDITDVSLIKEQSNA